jgi:ABC-type branched-subunit amino acid transport system substrate-binding protein
MRTASRRRVLHAAALPAWLALPSATRAQKRYGPGVTDTEIRIGQTMPFSGPLSMRASLGKSSAAYFDKLNAEGGINGRRVKLLAFDDAYSPPRTVEGTRRLVEQEEVLLIFLTIGTPTNIAIHRYLNDRKVPQLLIMSGANRCRTTSRPAGTRSTRSRPCASRASRCSRRTTTSAATTAPACAPASASARRQRSSPRPPTNPPTRPSTRRS